MKLNTAQIFGRLSNRVSLPVLKFVSPSEAREASEETVAGYRACQDLARRAAREVESHMKEGWTEIQAADLLGTYLRDHGVKRFFHHPFAWFGERTRFRGIRSYGAFRPSRRRLQPSEVFILDVAPILDGYPCDIGYTSCLGENAELEKAKRWLRKVRGDLPGLFERAKSGGEVWKEIDKRMKADGYDNIHAKYPFGVLGHRVPRVRMSGLPVQVLNFGWQSFWSLGSRGLFGQLLAKFHEGTLKGLWAIEPHLGTKTFGAKFEEILAVDDRGARWIGDEFV